MLLYASLIVVLKETLQAKTSWTSELLGFASFWIASLPKHSCIALCFNCCMAYFYSCRCHERSRLRADRRADPGAAGGRAAGRRRRALLRRSCWPRWPARQAPEHNLYFQYSTLLFKYCAFKFLGVEWNPSMHASPRYLWVSTSMQAPLELLAN